MEKGGDLEVVEGELCFGVTSVDGGDEVLVVGSYIPVSNHPKTISSSSKRKILSYSFFT